MGTGPTFSEASACLQHHRVGGASPQPPLQRGSQVLAPRSPLCKPTAGQKQAQALPDPEHEPSALHCPQMTVERLR